MKKEELAGLLVYTKNPSASILYLYLASCGALSKPVPASYTELQAATGLGRMTLQRAVSHLEGLSLLRTIHTSRTSTTAYKLQKPRLRK